MNELSQGEQSLRRAVLHTDWCFKRPGKFAAKIQAGPDDLRPYASRVRLMVESKRDFSSSVWVEFETTANVEVGPVVESGPPVEWQLVEEPVEDIDPALGRTMPKYTCTPPDEDDLEFLAYEYPFHSYDFIPGVLEPTATRTTIRAGYTSEGEDTVLYERHFPTNDARQSYSCEMTVGVAVQDFYDRPDADVRCGLEFASTDVLGDLRGDRFTWPFEVPRELFASQDDANSLDGKRYLAIECEGDGVTTFTGYDPIDSTIPEDATFGPTYNHTIGSPVSISVCRDANSSGVISDSPDVTPFRFDQPYNGSGLITLTFTSCFGAGAIGAVTAPVGVPGVANGPISETVVYDGGGGYAVLGRVQPSVDGFTVGAGSSAAISTTLDESDDLCGRPVWGVASVSVDDGGYGYINGAECDFTTSDGTVQEVGHGIIESSSHAPTLSIEASGHAETAFSVSIATRGTAPQTWEITAVSFSGDDTGYTDNEQLYPDFIQGDVEHDPAEIRARTIFDEDDNDTGVLDYIEVVYGGIYARDGVIDSIAVAEPGEYYAEDESASAIVADVTVNILQAFPSAGAGAELSAVVGDDPEDLSTFGKITGVTIDEGGSGYLAGEVYPEEITEEDEYYLRRFDKVRNVRHNVANGDSWHASHLIRYGSDLAERLASHRLVVEFVADVSGYSLLPPPYPPPGEPYVFVQNNGFYTVPPQSIVFNDKSAWNSLAGTHTLEPEIGGLPMVPNKYHKSYTEPFGSWDYDIQTPESYVEAEGPEYIYEGVTVSPEERLLTEEQWEALQAWPATTRVAWAYTVYPKISAWSDLSPGAKSIRYAIDFSDSGIMSHDFDAAFNTVSNPAQMLTVDTFGLDLFFKVDLLYKVEITGIRGYRADRTKGELYPGTEDVFRYPATGIMTVYENQGGAVAANRRKLFRDVGNDDTYDFSVHLTRSEINSLSAGETVTKDSVTQVGGIPDEDPGTYSIRLRVEKI